MSVSVQTINRNTFNWLGKFNAVSTSLIIAMLSCYLTTKCQTRNWKQANTGSETKGLVSWRACQTETQASGWNNKHKQRQMILREWKLLCQSATRLPSSGQRVKSTPSQSLLFADKSQVTARESLFCARALSSSQSHWETISLKDISFRSIDWKDIVKSQAVSRIQWGL